MRFDEKARENLAAVERLLSDETGERDALCNAAASRAYYAAYLAVSDRALRDGRSFTSNNRDYFRHDSLPLDARQWYILDENVSEALMWLRDLRIKADYFEDFVVLEETSEALDVARSILDAALEEVN